MLAKIVSSAIIFAKTWSSGAALAVATCAWMAIRCSPFNPIAGSAMTMRNREDPNRFVLDQVGNVIRKNLKVNPSIGAFS